MQKIPGAKNRQQSNRLRIANIRLTKRQRRRSSKWRSLWAEKKTKRAAAKRFKVTGTGKLKRNKAYKSHILTKKTTKRKRNLRKSALVDETNVKTMKKIMPYS